VRYDLVDLKLFVHAVESGSITAGAERSHLALASASARLRGMEEFLGLPLLQRNRYGVVPTEAGHALLRHARGILLQAENMHADLAAYAGGLKGQVRLLANTAARSEFLPPLLAGYLAQHPQVNIELEEKSSHDIPQAIADGMADIGVVADTVAAAVLEQGLQSFPFREDRLVVACAAGHELAKSAKRRRGLVLSDLADYDFLGLAGASALQQHISEQAAAIGKRLRYRLRLPDFEAICRMAAGGAGIAIISEAAAVRHAQTMALRHFRLDEPWALRKLQVVVRREEDLPAHARALVQCMTDDARECELITNHARV
jgi:DNA-binding transcriptional LysR family regulator